MKKLTEEWLSYAKKDLLTAIRIAADEELTSIAAFHCQQCIEKSLKAVLVEKAGTVPKVHNILKLYSLASGFIEIQCDQDQLNRITDVYTDSRYPNEIGLLPEGAPSMKTVQNFIAAAQSIYEQVLEKLSPQ